jgi:hypothetical protein
VVTVIVSVVASVQIVLARPRAGAEEAQHATPATERPGAMPDPTPRRQ